jgi:hypothetical protein
MKLLVQSVNQVKEYLHANGVAWDESSNYFTVTKYGVVPDRYLTSWTHPTIPEPTAEDLAGIDPDTDRSVPQRVTQRQFRLALYADGFTSATIELLLADLPNAETALIEWQYASFIERNNSLILLLGPSLGYNTNEAIDDLFRAASAI